MTDRGIEKNESSTFLPWQAGRVASRALPRIETAHRYPPHHPDLAAIVPEAAEVAELQKRVLHTYNDENGLPPHWNDQLRKMV